ncbi:hypothetical protein DESC_720071 [Desulfosarcina cetonica]|uniref:hypothetical protein n=1 Tax=Desulfosarcina cetonica TaxID=90730 RepID=UPI0006CF690D|nr:hypothetical protein [Desulfosarcina cetonica]VTR68693.1 hypothetical protein DESC_720071 [Desulfosarcina cetonica]
MNAANGQSQAMPGTAFQHVDDYSLRHLSDHLSVLQRAGSLYRLVTHPRWLARSAEIDASELLYKQDIDRACLVSGQRLDQHPEPSKSDLTTALVRPAVLAWLSGNWGLLANRVSTSALEALALWGELSQALDRAQRYPNPIQRARALIRIGDVACRMNYGNVAHGAWKQARELLLASHFDFFNKDLEALALLTQSLANAGWAAEARNVGKIIETRIAKEIEWSGGVNSSAHVAQVAAWGVLGRKEAILGYVEDLENDRRRYAALVTAARKALSNHPGLAQELLDRALALHSEKQPSQDIFNLAIVLAESGRPDECEKIIGDRLSEEKHARLTVAYAKSAFMKNNLHIGRDFLKRAIASAVSLSPDAALRVVKDLINCEPALAPANHDPGVTDLIARIRQDDRARLIGSDLGVVALGLTLFSDRLQAREAIAAALDWRPSIDGWQEVSTLCRLATILGRRGDRQGLDWIMIRLGKCRNSWPQAELARALAAAYREAGNETQARQAETILQAAAMGTNDTEWRLNAKGVLALWHAARNQPDSKRIACDMITALLDEMARGNSAPDDLAGLALTLAEGGRGDLSDGVFERTVDAIRAEPDSNTVARTIGTASEAAVLAERPAIMDRLIPLARGIEDSYLQAEALFWLAGWKARAQSWRESRQLFHEATEKGLDTSVSLDRIEDISNGGGLDEVQNIALAIGYPPTLAAAIFSGLMMALEKPDLESVLSSLPVLGHMIEGYDHFRYLCHRYHFAALDRLPDRKNNLIRYWAAALELNRKKDADEVWAVIAAGLPTLVSRFGSRLAKLLCAELSRLDPAGTSNPLRDFMEI